MKKKKSATKGLYRDGDKLVIREGARFPARCAICNKPSAGAPRPFVFSRQKAHYIEVAAIQTVAHAAADFLKGARYTGPVHADMPLCSWHRSRRLMQAGLGVGMTLLAIAFVFVQYL